MDVTPVSVNGDAGVVVEVDGEVDQVLSCSVADGKVVAIRITRNPDKLGHVDLGFDASTTISLT